MPKKGELKPIPHGTYGGTQQHRKRGIPIDEEDSCGCRKAHREYMAEWRKRSSKWKTRDKFNARVRTKVGAQLMLRHPAETRELMTKAKREVRAEMLRELKEKANG
jgi:hypothetical protein